MRIRINEPPYPIVDMPRKVAMQMVAEGRATVVSEDATLDPPEVR